MASVTSQLIEGVTAHAQSDSLEDVREICADGSYLPNNLRICRKVSMTRPLAAIFMSLSLLCRIYRLYRAGVLTAVSQRCLLTVSVAWVSLTTLVISWLTTQVIEIVRNQKKKI